MRRDGRDTDAVHVMIGGIAVAGGAGLLWEPWPAERICTAFCGASLADLSGSAIAATSAAPSPSSDTTDGRPTVFFWAVTTATGGTPTAAPTVPPPTSTSTATTESWETMTRWTSRAAAARCLRCCQRSGRPRPRFAALWLPEGWSPW